MPLYLSLLKWPNERCVAFSAKTSFLPLWAKLLFIKQYRRNKWLASFVSDLGEVGQRSSKAQAMSIFSSLLEQWHELVYTRADYRTRDRLLMGSPLPIIAICIFYVYLIKIYLAKFMEWRKAYDTRYVSLALNSYLFATACYFFYNSIVIGWFTKYSWRCEPLDTSDSAEALVVMIKIWFLKRKLNY